MTTTDKAKPQADDKGLYDLLGSTKQTSTDIIANDEILISLIELGQGAKLRQFSDTFTIHNGDSRGEIINTAGKVAFILNDHSHQPANIGIYTPNSDEPIEVTDLSQPCAFIIGNLSLDSVWYAVKSLAEGIALYRKLMSQGLNATILVSVNPFHFNNMVKHFAEVKQVIVMTTLDKKDSLTKPLIGVNVKAIITVFDLLLSFDNGRTLDDVLSESETIIKDLLADTWGDPEPLASDPNKPTPYPINAFTGLLRRVIELVAYYAQVPLAMAGNCVLGALAHMGQRFIDAPMGHGHMPASLILITEGESGSGKTQVMDLTHFKIDEHERQQYEQYLIDLDIWESDKVGLKGAELKDYLSTTPKPTNPKTVFDDATIEPILDKFVDGEINNASWATDEAGQFFNGHTMKGDTVGNALGAITKLHSSGRAARQRSQKSAYATPRTDAYDVRMTLLLQGQRVILEPALTDPLMNGQGFLARALIACPEDLRGKRVWNDEQRNNDNPHDNSDLIEYWSRCHSLLDPLPANEPTDAQGTLPRLKIRWEDNYTRQVFNNLAQGIENRQAQGQALSYLKAYASRMAENASRIASLMAFFEGRKVITTDDITRSFMLVEYSTAERLRYLDATPTGEQNDSEKLSQWLIDKARGKNPHELNRTDIYNGAPKPMRKNNRILQGELDNLESKSHIRQTDEGRKKIIEVNPKLYK
jgi:histone H3/H4